MLGIKNTYTLTSLIRKIAFKYIAHGCLLMLLSTSISALHAQEFMLADSMDTRLYTAEDSAYSKIIIADVGSFALVSSEEALTSRYEYQRRWKLFGNTATPFSEKISYNPSIPSEELVEIKITTYTPVAEGLYKVEKVSKEDLLEVVDPNAYTLEHRIEKPVPGMFVDYQYVILSPDVYFPRPWKFQHEVPCRYSEYTTAVPQLFTYYNTLESGSFSIKRKEEFYMVPGVSATSYYDPPLPGLELELNGEEIKYNKAIYSVSDVPAWESEPYIPTMKDYIPTLCMQLKENFTSNRRSQRKFILDWENFNNKFMESDNFGRYLEPLASLEVAAKKLTFKAKNNRERIHILYDFVRNNITWDGSYSIFPTNLEYAMEVRKGTNSDINFLLLSMLKSLKIEAYPVLISTRDNGKINPFYPFVKQFNHVLIVVNLGSQFILLDALGKGIEFEMIPRNNLNKVGFLIDKDRWGWMDISPKKGIERYVFGRILLDTDNTIEGELTVLYKGYSAAIQRNLYSDLNKQPEKYIREKVFNNFPDLELEEYEFRHEEVSDKPFTVKIKFKTRNFLRSENEYMFLEPLMMRMIEENPFKNDKRKYPVDFACPISEKFIITVLLPEGYETLQVPHSIYAVLPNNAGSFKYDSQQIDRHLQLISHIEINKTDFNLTVYPDIQAFFSFIVEKHNEDIILKRILE